MAIGDVYRLTRKTYVDGSAAFNVLHFLQTVADAGDPEAELVAAWDKTVGLYRPEKAWMDATKGFTSFTHGGYEVQKVFPEEGETRTFGTEVSPPTAFDTGLPTFATIKTSIITDRQDRSGRGGFFFTGIMENGTDGQTVNSNFQTPFDGLLQAIIEVHTAGGAEYAGFAIGVFSRLLLEFNAATALSYPTSMGTQVRRKLGRGI